VSFFLWFRNASIVREDPDTGFAHLYQKSIS